MRGALEGLKYSHAKIVAFDQIRPRFQLVLHEFAGTWPFRRSVCQLPRSLTC